MNPIVDKTHALQNKAWVLYLTKRGRLFGACARQRTFLKGENSYPPGSGKEIVEGKDKQNQMMVCLCFAVLFSEVRRQASRSEGAVNSAIRFTLRILHPPK